MVNTLNNVCLEKILEAYRHDFTPQHWDEEKYKWRAVKHFRDHWDLDAHDFPEMLKFSLSRTGNLLAGMKRYPARMIVHFAEADPKTVQHMFANLFHSEREIYGRIDEFKAQAALLLEKYADKGKQHYQNENAISTYLWLRYPEKYYIYKFNEGKMVADALESNRQFVIADYANNVRNFYELYDEIRKVVAGDSKLLSLYHSYLSDEFYPDPELRILTADVGYYIAKHMEKEQRLRKMGDPRSTSRKGNTADERINLRKISAEEKDEPVERQGFWWLNVNPKIWSLSNWPVGAAQAYTLYSGSQGHIPQNSPDAKPGDMVIGYESAPVKQVVALARVCEKQNGETICFEKLEGLSVPIDYSALKDCPELAGMEFFRGARGSLFQLTAEEYGIILDMIRQENPIQPAEVLAPYSERDFLGEVYMKRECYVSLTEVLRDKKNIILQGPPGVGKTFAAKRLAWAMMGKKDESRIQFIQFHQNYSYEDFVMGYKPTEKGFELKYGVFYQFCQKAANHPDLDYFFIIDEINRGNMSKIFGELLMLIEKEYRGTKMTMSYNGLPFSIPKNLYIIGMMNTADRSLAMIDYALRRRFGFFEMRPGFDSDGFIRYQSALGSNQFDQLIARVKELNQEILQDRSLGRGFSIGHSYFCGRGECTGQWLRLIVNHDILPTLSEYWFDDPDRVARWERVLHGTLA